MDRITPLIQEARKVNAWDTLSNEEVIELALLASLECNCCTPVIIEFLSFDDDKEEPVKRKFLSRIC